MKKLIIIATACSLMAGLGIAQAGDVAAGKAKSATCAGCHGADGNSVVPMYPKLAGQHAQYIAKQLHAFKDGTRNDPIMKGMSAPLSDADIDNLSAYFAAQAPK